MEGATTTPAATATAAPPAEDIAAAAPLKPKKTPRVKSTFTLHDPSTMQVIGKLSSSDPRYAALKAASKGHSRILLRKTGTRVIREYTGSLQVRPACPAKSKLRSPRLDDSTPLLLLDTQKLDTPQIVKRGEREISYFNKPHAKYMKQWEWAGASEAAMKQEVDD